jgi:nicotinamide-nucleotide amidase
VDVPGASSVLRGAVVAYATDLKHSLLGVPSALLESRGPVDAQVARHMAAGVRERLGATWGIAATGVAGPANQDGSPPGTAFVAVSGPDVDVVRPLTLPGGREVVREGATRSALELLAEVLDR